MSWLAGIDIFKYWIKWKPGFIYKITPLNLAKSWSFTEVWFKLDKIEKFRHGREAVCAGRPYMSLQKSRNSKFYISLSLNQISSNFTLLKTVWQIYNLVLCFTHENFTLTANCAISKQTQSNWKFVMSVCFYSVFEPNRIQMNNLEINQMCQIFATRFPLKHLKTLSSNRSTISQTFTHTLCLIVINYQIRVPLGLIRFDCSVLCAIISGCCVTTTSTCNGCRGDKFDWWNVSFGQIS